MLAILTTHPIQYQVPLWKALSASGQIQFEVWYLNDHGTKPSYDTQFGQTFAWNINTLAGYPYRFIRVNKSPNVSRFSGLRIEESLGALMQEHGVQTLWVQGWQVLAYWQAVWTAHAQGIPLWMRAETNDLHRSHWIRQFPRSIVLGQLFKRISYFLYIGSANRRFYQNFGVPDSKLVAAPYFVDNERFEQVSSKIAPERDLLRQKWNIPKEAICFLFCGKFIAKKHPLDLLEAAHILLKNSDLGEQLPFHILFVGEGELRPILEAKAHELDCIAGRSIVTFAGFINQAEIPEAYVAADCLILPSDAGETWGLVVNEALACGRPAIVSHLCGCAEDLVEPIDANLVFQCGDVGELSNRMYKQIKSAATVNKVDEYKKILQRHDLSTTLRTVVKTFATENNAR